MSDSRCRFCRADLSRVFADLGSTPLANSFRSEQELGEMEPFYPLRAMVCERCFLVQLDEYETPDQIFSEYAYFSSYSSSWLDHARSYTEMAVERFGLGAESRVVEVASNDGYLLQFFRDRDIPVLGIEPAANVAEVAEEKGIRTLVKFFGQATAREVAATLDADLVIANNVLAHVPDLRDFVAGMEIILAPEGTITVEFPHLMHLVEQNEFDTIYHEHFSYFSFLTVSRVFEEHGMKLYDVEELPTHGGSLRIFAAHAGDDSKQQTDRAAELIARELEAGYDRIETYLDFAEGVKRAKFELLELLLEQRRAGKRIAAYGAPAKGNTLLNYCGVGPELIEFTVDRNPHKQGRHLPGTHIPIRDPEAIREERPDVIFILPWNLREEITEQLEHVREWDAKFLVRTPRLELFS